MQHHAKSGLSGSKTEENLKAAAANEALAHMKYKLFSEIAQDEALIEVSRRLSALSENEKEHAELWLSYLAELGETFDNIEDAMSNEVFEREEFYPNAAKMAKEEGFHEISSKFNMAAQVEGHHKNELDDIKRKMGETAHSAETEWRCLNCGHGMKGNTPPERCPLCSYPKGFFSKS